METMLTIAGMRKVITSFKTADAALKTLGAEITDSASHGRSGRKLSRPKPLYRLGQVLCVANAEVLRSEPPLWRACLLASIEHKLAMYRETGSPSCNPPGRDIDVESDGRETRPSGEE